MISAYLAEDEPLARAALAAMLRATEDFEVVGECDNGAQALQDCLQCSPDVLFADIEMPLRDGLELAAALGEQRSRTQVVFITEHDAHAVQAFRLAAVDYLLKPVGAADFHDCLNRLRRVCRHDTSRLARSPPQYRQHFIVRSVGRIELVQTHEIVALRASGNYLNC